jgi:hypothetical protein
MNKIQLKKLKAKLPNKWRTSISQKTGFTSAYIDLVLNGQRDHESEGAKLILKTAVKLAEKHASEKTELKKAVSELS